MKVNAKTYFEKLILIIYNRTDQFQLVNDNSCK